MRIAAVIPVLFLIATPQLLAEPNQLPDVFEVKGTASSIYMFREGKMEKSG